MPVVRVRQGATTRASTNRGSLCFFSFALELLMYRHLQTYKLMRRCSLWRLTAGMFVCEPDEGFRSIKLNLTTPLNSGSQSVVSFCNCGDMRLTWTPDFIMFDNPSSTVGITSWALSCDRQNSMFLSVGVAYMGGSSIVNIALACFAEQFV